MVGKVNSLNFITPFFLILVVGLGIVGCQSQTSELVTITMMSGSVGKEFTVLEAQVAQFEAEHPNIQVQLIDLPESTNDRHAAYVELFQRQEPSVDVLVVDLVWTPEFGAAGWTLPLDDYVAAHQIDMNQFLAGAVQGNTWNGQLVSMPWFTDAGLLFYRQDLLAKYGFEPPQRWSELVEIATTITTGEAATSPEMVGFVFQGREYEGLVTNYLEYVWSNGAAVLDSTGEQVLLDSPEAVQALEILAAMPTIASPGIASFQEGDALNYFQSGHAVFMRNWPFAWAVVNDDRSAVQGQVGIAPLPHGPNGQSGASTLGGWQLGINAHSRHPDEAFELIAFLTSQAQQNYKAIHAGQAPTRLASYRDPEVLAANPYFDELVDIVLQARPRPVHPRYQEISRIIQREVHRVLVGQQEAATATRAMAVAIQQIVASPVGEETP